MQPWVVQCILQCETKGDEVHVFLLFVFTELDTAQPRGRNRVQPILLSIFLELACRLIASVAPKRRRGTSMPNEQRTGSSHELSMEIRDLCKKISIAR